jgi:hypothetical protein
MGARAEAENFLKRDWNIYVCESKGYATRKSRMSPIDYPLSVIRRFRTYELMARSRVSSGTAF